MTSSSKHPERISLSPQLRLVSLIVAAAFFMQLLDTSIINTSLPQMAKSFGMEPLGMSMGITVYLLATAVFIPLSAWMAERFGARQVFLVAIGIFTLSSLACGVAQTFWQFVLARACQGIGGALMTPVGRILVLRNAEKGEIIHVTALIAWPALFAPVIGPFIGGFVTTYFSWRWNFFINLPLGLIGMALVWRFVPRVGVVNAARLDVKGFVLCALSLACLLYGLESIVHGAGPAILSAGLIALGGGAGWLALRHLARAENPLLDLKVFRVKTFALSTLTSGTYQRIMINATPFLLPLTFQVSFGMTALEAGSLLLAYFLGNLAMKTITTPVLRTFGFRRVLSVNGIACSLAIALFAAFPTPEPYWLLIALLIFAGLTRSMQFTALNTLAFADLEQGQRSTASSITSILQQVAMLVGVAIAVAILAASQHARGAAELGVFDFRVTFLAMAAIGICASVAFFTLAPDAGAEVSGHRAKSRLGEAEN